MRRFEAAYVKYIKSFFGFECRYSVTEMFCDLGLSTFNTVFKFGSFSVLNVLYVVCFLVCLSFVHLFVPVCYFFIGHVA